MISYLEKHVFLLYICETCRFVDLEWTEIEESHDQKENRNKIRIRIRIGVNPVQYSIKRLFQFLYTYSFCTSSPAAYRPG